RSLAIAAVYLGVVAAVSGATFAVGPRLSTELQSLAQKLPEMSKQIQSGAIARIVQAHTGEIIGYAQQATAALLRWLTGAWVIVLIPVFAFFILKDADQFTSSTISRLSQRGHRGVGWGIAADLHLLLGQYVR